jgi:hypothetical protein
MNLSLLIEGRGNAVKQGLFSCNVREGSISITLMEVWREDTFRCQTLVEIGHASAGASG